MILPFAVFQLSQYIFGPLLFLLSTFIILLILLQRGRGGGLTGALGGAGGSSAFGVKAGDILTRITAFSVLGWIILCAFVCWFYLPAQLDIEADAEITATSGAGSMTVGSGETKPLTTEAPKNSETTAPPASTDSGEPKPNDSPAKPEAGAPATENSAAKPEGNLEPETPAKPLDLPGALELPSAPSAAESK